MKIGYNLRPDFKLNARPDLKPVLNGQVVFSKTVSSVSNRLLKPVLTLQHKPNVHWEKFLIVQQSNVRDETL